MTFSTRTGKSAKLFKRQLCLAYVVKRMLYKSHTFITNACWVHIIASSFSSALTEFSCKQLCWIPGHMAGTRNQDFVLLLMALPKSNICYCKTSGRITTYFVLCMKAKLLNHKLRIIITFTVLVWCHVWSQQSVATEWRAGLLVIR